MWTNDILIMYASKTGKVEKFVEKINNEKVHCLPVIGTGTCEYPYVLVTYTTGFGQVPKEVEEFLNIEGNSKYLLGVASSGNKGWGKSVFAKSGDIISEKYNVPLLLKFENDGFNKDVKLFEERVHELYGKLH